MIERFHENVFFFDFLSALIIALLIAAVFSGLGRQGPWASFWILFLILFLAAWAGGIWVQPMGPPVWGLYWIPFLCVALLFALILAAATPPRRPPGATGGENVREDTSGAALALEAFFWIWVIVLALLIFSHYVWW